jgi:hypothetical protein
MCKDGWSEFDCGPSADETMHVSVDHDASGGASEQAETNPGGPDLPLTTPEHEEPHDEQPDPTEPNAILEAPANDHSVPDTVPEQALDVPGSEPTNDVATDGVEPEGGDDNGNDEGWWEGADAWAEGWADHEAWAENEAGSDAWWSETSGSGGWDAADWTEDPPFEHGWGRPNEPLRASGRRGRRGGTRQAWFSYKYGCRRGPY